MQETNMPSDFIHALLFIVGFGSIFIGIILLEAWYWRRRGDATKYRLVETLSNMTSGVMYKFTDGLVVALFATIGFDWVWQFGLQYQPSNMIIGGIVLFFVVDFSFWFFHVFMHKVRWGWASHVIHHSSHGYNFSTALRQNFLLDLTGVQFLWWLPVALVGFDKLSVVVAIELNLVYQFFIHTQAIRKLPRWFEFIFNTPSHHRVHHGSNPAQIDRNFGGVLIIWDRIFGTFVSEEDAGEIKYGIGVRQPTTLNPIRLSVDEFVCMWRDVWYYKDVRILWKEPDWVESHYGRGDY
jgi:sterol desaturase/sphingolipid hydroxylase (fatty acid hydroxylase superfamily)